MLVDIGNYYRYDETNEKGADFMELGDDVLVLVLAMLIGVLLWVEAGRFIEGLKEDLRSTIDPFYSPQEDENDTNKFYMASLLGMAGLTVFIVTRDEPILS